jgi:hypothetical protein
MPSFWNGAAAPKTKQFLAGEAQSSGKNSNAFAATASVAQKVLSLVQPSLLIRGHQRSCGDTVREELNRRDKNFSRGSFPSRRITLAAIWRYFPPAVCGCVSGMISTIWLVIALTKRIWSFIFA